VSDIGQRVGRYVIRGELGCGGMGRVLRGYDEKLHREVALKEVRGDRLGPSGARRLVAEARAMGKLSHPNVVALYDVLELGDDEVVLVMEYVDGETLADWLRSPRTWQEIVARFEQAGRGLAAAHAAGVLHRDFKPDNVMVGRDGRVRVTDFGLAREVESVRTDESRPGAELEPPTLGLPPTAPGAIVGTLPYLAPERLFGAPADPSTDQFAFCVSLWEALFGQRPFAGRSVVELALAITAGPATAPVTTPPIPPRLIDTVRRGLAEHASERWPDLDALLAALPDDRPPRRRWWPVGVAAATATLALVVYAAAIGDPPPVGQLHAQLRVTTPELGPAPLVHAEVRAAAWPPSAVLYLDGTPLDGNPTVVKLAHGDTVHRIEARAAGYETRATEIVAGKDREVMLELKPPPTARARPRRSGARAREDALPLERESTWEK
jgi:predicted Ser/Thr protein kinase